MVLHVINALEQVAPDQIVVVVGHGADHVAAAIDRKKPAWANIMFAQQTSQNGTGGAAVAGLETLGGDDYADDDASVLVLPGDTPLLRADTLDELVADHVANSRGATMLTSVVADPAGYGRVIRDKAHDVQRIVEQRDASAAELEIDEINAGMYTFRRDLLGPTLRSLTTDNAQGELLLTDVIAKLSSLGHRVGALAAPLNETRGVNDRWQLALAERELRNRINRHWLLNGVTMFDPRQTFIDIDVQIGRDVTLFPATMLQGKTVVGSHSEIGPHVQLTDTTVGSNTVVQQTVAAEASVGSNCSVGPFVHLPAGTTVEDGTTVNGGTTLAAPSSAPHSNHQT